MSLKKLKQSNNLLWFIVITFIVKIFLIHFVHNVALDLYFGKAWTKKLNHKVNGGCTQMLKNVLTSCEMQLKKQRCNGLTSSEREANAAADLSTGQRYHRPSVLYVKLEINGNYCSLKMVQHLNPISQPTNGLSCKMKPMQWLTNLPFKSKNG